MPVRPPLHAAADFGYRPPSFSEVPQMPMPRVWPEVRNVPLVRQASRLVTGALLALTVVVAGAAAARADDNVVHEADKTVFKKKTVIDFNDVTLEGDLTKPEGSYILNRGKTRFGSLIKVRDNFNDELRKSSDNL